MWQDYTHEQVEKQTRHYSVQEISIWLRLANNYVTCELMSSVSFYNDTGHGSKIHIVLK